VIGIRPSTTGRASSAEAATTRESGAARRRPDSALVAAARRLESRHRVWRYRTRTDRAEIAWLRSVLQPGDLVIDAGAYKGGYTHWMRDAVGATGRVIAFEPQPELAAFLQRMVAAFLWDNVQVEPVGLSSGRGARTLFVPGAGASQRASLEWEREGARAYDVALISLDDYAADHLGRRPVALVKCDVEGHELDVFRGARRIVEAYRPLLLFECEARHAPARGVRDVFEHLETSGYAGSFFLEDELIPVADFRPAVHQVPGRRPYVNNFVFVPDARR